MTHAHAHRARPVPPTGLRGPVVLALIGALLVAAALLWPHTYDRTPRPAGHVTTPPTACVAAICVTPAWPAPALPGVRR